MKYILLMILFLVNVNVNASTVDFNRKGSININLRDNENSKGIENIEITLYKIADAKEKDHNLVYEYSNIKCNASLDNLLDSELVNKLGSCINDDIIVGKMYSDVNGNISFNDLPLGLYLIKQTNRVKGYSVINSYLVNIPIVKDNKFVYVVDSKPKTEILSLIDINVLKVWNSARKEEFVDVNLLLDDVVIDTVRLNGNNDWKYTWEDLEKGNYSVKEINVPKGYVDTYEKLDNTFIITNSAKLVQTGVNYYVSLVFMFSGLSLILIGIYLRKNK